MVLSFVALELVLVHMPRLEARMLVPARDLTKCWEYVSLGLAACLHLGGTFRFLNHLYVPLNFLKNFKMLNCQLD